MKLFFKSTILAKRKYLKPLSPLNALSSEIFYTWTPEQNLCVKGNVYANVWHSGHSGQTLINAFWLYTKLLFHSDSMKSFLKGTVEKHSGLRDCQQSGKI